MTQWTTLRSLLEAHPEQFAAQSWYLGEAFLERRLGRRLEGMPQISGGLIVPEPHKCPTAVELADLYLREPQRDIWRKFLWCKDADQWGQRIFVGGLGMTRGFSGQRFQIHRFVQPTPEWLVAVW